MAKAFADRLDEGGTGKTMRGRAWSTAPTLPRDGPNHPNERMSSCPQTNRHEQRKDRPIASQPEGRAPGFEKDDGMPRAV